jgi:hypothetical protein
MLIDRMLPDFDATRIEHRVVAGPVSDAYAAAVAVDFVDAIRQSQALRALLALRAQTERIASVLRRSGPAVKAVGPETVLVRRDRVGADRRLGLRRVRPPRIRKLVPPLVPS